MKVGGYAVTGSRGEKQAAGKSVLFSTGPGMRARVSTALVVGLLAAGLALGACTPDTSPMPTELPGGTATDTATAAPTPTATAIAMPTLAPGLDFTLGVDWPVIGPDTASSVASLYAHSLDGLVEVLGSSDWDYMTLISPDRTALLATQDLSPVNIIETVGYGSLVAAAMNQSTLVMAFREGGVRLFDVPTGAPTHLLDAELVQLALSPDGALLAGGSLANVVYMWDVDSGELLGELAIGGFPNNLTFSPDGVTLAVEIQGGPFEGIELWNVERGERMLQLEWAGRAGPLYFVRFSPDWKVAAWVSRATVLLRDTETGEERAPLAHEDFVDETLFSPDGTILATTSAALIEGELTGVVDLWDTVSGDNILTLAHGDAAALIAFSPDGSLLASATYDGMIRLWDVASAEMLAELHSEQEEVFRLFFAEGGRLLVSTSREDAVRFWAVEQ